MKLTCMAQMYNEHSRFGWDAQTNIERFMRSISKYCDALVMYDDACDDGSVGKVLEWRGKENIRLKEIQLLHGKKNDFKNEMNHKAQCLHACKQIGSDWIIWLDVDEVIEAAGEMGAVRELCHSTVKGAVNLFNVNLWRTDRYYRVDDVWNAGLFCRLWRLTDALHYEPQRGLHKDLVPKGILGRDTKQLKVIHYGFATDESILHKYHTYKSHGQSGWPLQRLVDEKSLRLADVDKKWFNNGPWGPDVKIYDKRLVEMI